MGSLLTGSKEIINIETDRISFTLKGELVQPKLDSIHYDDNVSSVSVNCADEYRISICGNNKTSGEGVYLSAPLFYEYTNYELIIEGDNKDEIVLWHDNQYIRQQVVKSSHKYSILSGVVNFGSDIGNSAFDVIINGKKYLTVIIEVFPSKIDYKDDYKAILDDLTSEIYNLTFDFLKKTYMSYKADKKQKSSPVEYFSILQKIFKDYLMAVDVIMSRPHHVLQTTHNVVVGHKLKRIDNKTIKWLSNHQQ